MYDSVLPGRKTQHCCLNLYKINYDEFLKITACELKKMPVTILLNLSTGAF